MQQQQDYQTPQQDLQTEKVSASAGDPLHQVFDLNQQDIEQNQPSTHTSSDISDSLVHSLIDIITKEEKSKKRRRDDSELSAQDESLDVWDLIPQHFTHVHLHANEIPSFEFFKILFLYGWAYSKYLQLHEGDVQESLGPSSPDLSQDGSSNSLNYRESIEEFEPAYKKLSTDNKP